MIDRLTTMAGEPGAGTPDRAGIHGADGWLLCWPQPHVMPSWHVTYCTCKPSAYLSHQSLYLSFASSHSSDPSHVEVALTIQYSLNNQSTGCLVCCQQTDPSSDTSITHFLSVTTSIPSISTGAHVQLLCITARPHGAAAPAECSMRLKILLTSNCSLSLHPALALLPRARACWQSAR